MYVVFFLQNRISTYDFPMFCENEKSIQPKTHTCVFHTNPNMTQSRYFGENSTIVAKQSDSPSIEYKVPNNRLVDMGNPIPLSKSTSLQAFSTSKLLKIPTENVSSKYGTSSKTNNSGSFWVTAEKININAIPSVKSVKSHVPNASLMQSKPKLGSNQHNKHDSESSSGSDLIDLTSKSNLPVCEMYNDDIDYMNNYLKSLPDYNELNRKITNEQQKCEDIYDRLLCINSSLKSNLLPKSNSYHSISTALTSPHQFLSAQATTQNGNTAKNNITRSSSSSVVNHSFVNSPHHDKQVGITPIKSTDLMHIKVHPSQIKSNITLQASPQTKTYFNETSKLQNTLPKNESSTSLVRSNSKKGLTDFWSENLAKTSQQKMGWNYSKIIASKLDNFKSNTGNISPTNGYKLQKNMSLSQLGQKIQQNVSREELYNLICNNEPNKPTDMKPLDLNLIRKYNNFFKPQLMQPSWSPKGVIGPLSKSVSQTSVPTTYTLFTKMKSPRKNNIPTIFKPLCKSSSNTHVLNPTHESQKDSFISKNLMKSSSSSSIFNSSSKNMGARIKQIDSSSTNKTDNLGLASVQADKSKANLNTQNNGLLKLQNQVPTHEMAYEQNEKAKCVAQKFHQFTQNRKNPISTVNFHLPIYPNTAIPNDILIKSPRKSMNNR